MKNSIGYQNYIEHYKKDAEFQDYFTTTPFERQNIRRRYEQFFALLPEGKLRILDIGSGGGFAADQAGKRNCQYFPFDIPVSNLIGIKEKTRNTIYPVSGDAFKLPVKSNTFDSVILSEVLEHLEHPVNALKEIQRVLKPGGKLLISVPYKEKISYQICVHCNQPTPTHAHFHSFDEDKLAGCISESKLTPITYLKITNKLATRLRLYILMKSMPFGIWKLTDMLLNQLIPIPSHLIYVAGKSLVGK